jgi:carboxypeptidase C (cathepsin A)
MPRIPAVIAALLFLCTSSALVGAESDQNAPSDSRKSADPPARVAHEPLSTTQHTAKIGGEEISYSATVGRIHLKDDKDADRAQVYYFAYIKSGVADERRRPITFSFNGGPGSSSVWLHMGLMGPKRVPMPDDASLPPPPYSLVANDQSLLDLTDVVMIDPVSTGVSRQAGEVEAKAFHGYTEDIRSVGDFIERFVTAEGRWQSPKFLVGESYGTTRAAGLAEYLQDEHGMFLNGIGMVSSVLNFQTLRFNNGNDLPYVLFLPSYTATAWYHKQLDDELQRDLEATLGEVEAFAAGEYSEALFAGARLSEDSQREAAEKLARFTGLSAAYVRRSNLRISMDRFAKELLRQQRRTIGRLDSRYLGIDRDAAGEAYEYDPSMSAIMGPYTALFNAYVRSDLGFELPRKYNIFGPVQPWSYDEFENRYVDASESLRKAMTANPALKVFVASGYYDLATPYFASDYTYHQLQPEPALKENITLAYYEAGHMMYIHGPSLVKLKEDLGAFYRSAAPMERVK